ncbi:MAG: alpha/beta hydrolase [Bryobacter sp.]|nr:alpha/beta hydrolase [Bryobacter sp.]
MRRFFLLSLLAVAAFAARHEKDIEFAKPGGFSLTLDASVPEGPGPHPAVIIVHGGGFVRGDKQTFVPPLFAPLEAGGFAWFSINYRLAPQFQHPAPAEDLAAAMKFLKQNAKRFNIDPARIAIMGESAGGTIVAHYGLTAKGDLKPKAVVDFYGIADWNLNLQIKGELSENAKQFLGPLASSAEGRRKASAIAYVSRNAPPFLFIHGTKDAQVPYEHSPVLCKALEQAGARCEVFTLEGAGHGVGGWEKVPAFQTYKAKMVEWLKANL